jgi:hypothetical protein
MNGDTARFELSKSEARVVIEALSSYQARTTGREERRALNVQEFLQREFGYKGDDFGEGRDLVESFADIFDAGEDETREIQLSRPEAEEIVDALDGVEADSADPETVRDLRSRFADSFESETHSEG